MARHAVLPCRLFCAGLALLTVLGACDQPDAEEFLRRARDYREQGDIAASIIELKNALQQEPKNAEARFLLGRNYLVIRDLAGAEKELLRAGQYGLPAEELAGPLAEVWMSQRQFEKVLTEIRIPESAPADSKASLAIARARARRALGDIEGAKQEFERALEQDPTRPLALVGLARIAMRRGDGAEVEASVARAFAAAPEDLNVLALKGDRDFLGGDYAAAEARYEAILAARPDSVVVRLALARTQIFQGKTGPAAGHLDRVLARVKAHPDASYLRATLALEAKDYEAARSYSEQVLLTNPNHGPSLLIAGAANYLLDRLEQAERHLTRVLAQDPENRLARRLDAATRLRLRRAKDGRPGSAPLLDDSLEPKALITLVDPKAKADAIRAAGRAYLAGLAAAYPEAVPKPRQASAGDAAADAQAMSLLEDAVAADPYAVAPRALLGQRHLDDGRPEQTLQAIGVALRDHPEHPVLLGLKGLAQLQAGRPGAAKLTFLSLVEIDPGAARAQYLLALAYREAGDPARYGERLDRVLERDPGHFQATLERIRLMAQAGDLSAAGDRIDGLLKTAPGNAEALDLSATIALLAGATEAAIGLSRRVLERAPSATASLKLAYLQQRAGDGSGSRATLTAWLRTAPDSIGVRMALANKHLAAGEFESARSHYTKINLLAPNNVAVLNNLAWSSLQLGDIASALDEIERAHRLAPDDPRVIDTFGLVQLRAGNAEAAARALRRAAGGMPDSPQVQTHLAQALAQQGEAAEAREILQRILSVHEDFPGRAEAASLLGELGG